MRVVMTSVSPRLAVLEQEAGPFAEGETKPAATTDRRLTSAGRVRQAGELLGAAAATARIDWQFFIDVITEDPVRIGTVLEPDVRDGVRDRGRHSSAGGGRRRAFRPATSSRSRVPINFGAPDEGGRNFFYGIVK